MKRSLAAFALVAGVCISCPATAQEYNTMETVVVTGMRSEYTSDAPHIYMVHRVDHLITKVSVICDTRDPAKRRQELKDTLRSMIREASKSGTISLGIGDEIVADLTDNMLDEVIEPDAKQDTSRAVVVIKTRVSKDDMSDAATARIERFIEATPKAGRTEVLREKDWELTIVGPEQYRSQLLAKVAADAKQTAAQFGPDYQVKVDGLQGRIMWFQKGPLDLALYIPYAMTVLPK